MQWSMTMDADEWLRDLDEDAVVEETERSYVTSVLAWSSLEIM